MAKLTLYTEGFLANTLAKTLILKVTENSNYNSYLSLQFLYQAGAAEITVVEVFEVLNTILLVIIFILYNSGQN